MDLRLDGKVALVTGASRGIGKAIAQAYADAGAKVLLSSRKQADLEAAAAEIGGDTAVFAANAGEPDQAEACVQHCIGHFGGLDILVNNAAANPYMGPLMGIDVPRAEKTVKVNQLGVVVWTQLAHRLAMAESGGSVINIASIGGYGVSTSIAYYDTTKAAVIHLTREMAAELAPSIRVNAIAPGLVKTDFARALWEPNEAAIARSMPLARLGEPKDIGNAALFLASDAASWITGHTLVVDGGALIRPTA
jgi:NAD(P)-dependent dehydrogenase (short-subunit alcohol dehydrogenase family)